MRFALPISWSLMYRKLSNWRMNSDREYIPLGSNPRRRNSNLGNILRPVRVTTISLVTRWNFCHNSLLVNSMLTLLPCSIRVAQFAIVLLSVVFGRGSCEFCWQGTAKVPIWRTICCGGWGVGVIGVAAPLELDVEQSDSTMVEEETVLQEEEEDEEEGDGNEGGTNGWGRQGTE